ncbi:unnamed protein product [Rotaria socialis]|uniref:Large ribosomal subunit protein mL43 n=2 Tax=Rotaria socialis TaxID=392032 RepID=A0A820U6D6_9BILA|nr:unnamed protein product [Rotaria socialis]CAF4482012.1 unnamed protein product [Rotaria socialis]
MNTHKSQLEDLPNELLSEILRNLDARDVFRAFYQVNSRFNELIQSFQHLQLTFHMNSNNFLKTNDEIFSFYVYTLIISPWINFNLQNFPRVRRLRLDNPLPKVLEQLQPNIMPHLEYLSVFYTYNMYEMVILHENVFSNRFVNLKSCELYEKQTLITIPHWTQSPSLQVLKTEYIDSTIFKIILGACPNLYFFKFYLYPTNGMTTDIPLHNNLKHMIIELQDVDWYYDDNTINAFLKSVPKLEQLEIHRRFYSQHMRENIKDYDWFSLIIKHRLPILRRFRFYFHLSKEEKLIGCIDENIQIQIELINTKLEDKLSCFPNIHRILLDYVTDDLITQFNSQVLPCLEYLSVSHKVSPFYMPDLRGKIFSNGFPNLKSCYISRMKPAYTLREWTRSPSLRFLRLNDIDASIYTSILLACPNLYYLKFRLPERSKIESNIVLHSNLKRLLINLNHDEWPWDDNFLDGYLACVPNLEKLRINRSVSVDSNVMNFLQHYDWLLSTISKRLLVIDRFEFDFNVKRTNGFTENRFNSRLMSQFLRRITSLPIQSIRSFHSFDDVTPAKYISTRLKNGVGSRYVCQLQRLTIQVCKEFRTSFGTRDWIANDLTKFAREHPYVVVYVQPRRHRAPNIVGEYLTGDRQWIPLSNCDREKVNWWIHSLLTQKGDPQWRLLKQMHTDSPSVQGIWTPFTNKPIDRITRMYPDKDLTEMEYPHITATQQIQELFEQEKLNKTS